MFSLIVMFVAMFQLMWYMMVLCGWIIYAVCYGTYWCIKKLITIFSRKHKNKSPKRTNQKSEAERKEDNTNMTPEINNTSNKHPKNQSHSNISKITRWIVGGFFALFALVNGFHYSSLFSLCAAFLMFPFPFMQSFLQKKNIKTIIAIILSIVLFFVGVITSPASKPIDSSADDTTQSTTDGTEDKNNNYIKPNSSTSNNSVTTKPNNTTSKPDSTTSNNNTTPEPDNTTSNDEQIEMVWVGSSGTKYHSKSTCSNMNSPRKISIEDAKKQGYGPCKNCH